jgi:hypothetical protein
MMIWAAAAAALFNLVCTGTRHTESVYHKKNEPFSYTYRFDLDRKIFCDGDCHATRPIPAVLPTRLRLTDDRVDNAAMSVSDFVYIDRQTGEFHGTYTYVSMRDRNGLLLIESTGHCERVDFTGFPVIENKF